MKRILLPAMVVLAAVAAAQQTEEPAKPAAPLPALTNIVERQQAPTYSDVHCAGFVTRERVPEGVFVAGGWASPHQSRFADRDFLYLKGSGLQVGARYNVVRRLRDPNQHEAFSGQRAMLRKAGHPYADLARVLVIGLNGEIAITQVEFSCSEIVPGDIAVPFVEKPTVAYRHTTSFDRFASPNGKLTGRIVMAKEFDTMAATGQKVYLNVGSAEGVKVGDYFRATRTYNTIRKHEADSLSFHSTFAEDTQESPLRFPHHRLNEFPRMSLGELVVLNVTPSSATAMITMALEDIAVGDGVELEEPAPATAADAPPQPPVISCIASTSTVSAGENATVTCNALSPDERPLAVLFRSDRGRVEAHGNLAVLYTHGADAGPVAVQATATDDRNLSTTSTTVVNIENSSAAAQLVR